MVLMWKLAIYCPSESDSTKQIIIIVYIYIKTFCSPCNITRTEFITKPHSTEENHLYRTSEMMTWIKDHSGTLAAETMTIQYDPWRRRFISCNQLWRRYTIYIIGTCLIIQFTRHRIDSIFRALRTKIHMRIEGRGCERSVSPHSVYKHSILCNVI